MALQIELCPDADPVARRRAEHVARQAGAAIAAHRRFTFAVSGGHTPWAMFAPDGEPIPCNDVTIFPVDERVAPAGDPDRHLTHLGEALGRAAAAEGRPMPAEAPDLERAAREYAGWLPESFDRVHLGLGTGRSHGFARAWRSGARDQRPGCRAHRTPRAGAG